MPVPNQKETFSYQDYLSLSDNERWEVIGGRLYNMSPAPSLKHQSVAGNFYRLLGNRLEGKPCVPWTAPIDVVLSDKDIVQPDVIVVCDPKKMTENNIQGAPDLVIEVVSPSTAKKDRWDKKKLYEKHGVKEYILADPDGRYIERFILEENGLFDKGEILDAKETLTLKILPDIKIPLNEIFSAQKLEN